MSGNGKALCQKCGHRETCRVPCAPVELYLAYENQAIYEQSMTTAEGEEVTILFTHGRELRESSFPEIGKDSAKPVNLLDLGEPDFFPGFNPHLKQTRLFCDRFFGKWTYKDLAVKYDCTPAQARIAYKEAVRRLREVLEALDGQNKSIHNFEPWKQMVAERSGCFPEGVRFYLLNKLFQLRPAEIARLEGKEPKAVRGIIIRISDKLKAGEISLFDFSEEESEAAKSRLEEKRAKRREYREKNKEREMALERVYREKNREKLRARDRERRKKDGPPFIPPQLRTHCPAGHEYAGDNLYIGPNGKRRCRACNRERSRRHNARPE